MINTIIHTGFPRTATTWFQKNFFTNVKNYTYVDRKIIQDKLIHPSSLCFSSIDFLSILPNEKLIISEEMITGRIRGGLTNHLFFKEFIGRTHSCFPEAHYIFFLRNQPELIHSLYKLYVQRGGTFSLSRFLHTDKLGQNNLLYSCDFLKYDVYLDYLINLIGKEKIHVFLYEDFLYQPKVFLEKFTKQFNFQVDNNSLDLESVNKSMMGRSLLFRRVLNSFTRHGIPFKHYYFHIPKLYHLKLPVIRKSSRKQTNLPMCIIKTEDNFKTSNKNVMDKFNLFAMKEYGYPLPD